MTIIASHWPPTAVRMQRTQSCQAGLADIPAQLGANAATMAGHATGGAVVADVSNPAPVNPSGDRGHDHSGGYFGRPLFRSVASLCLDTHTAYSSNVLGQTDTTAYYLGVEAAGDGVTSWSDRHVIFDLWVPPCPPGGAYEDLGLFVTGTYALSGMLSGDTVTLEARNLHSAIRSPANGAPLAFELTVDTPAAGGLKTLEGGSGERVRVVPGALNAIKVGLKAARTTGGGSRSCGFTLRDVEMGVYET